VFHNHFDQLVLYLETSLRDAATRRKLYELGSKNESLFNELEDPATEDYPNLYSRTFLTPEHQEKYSEGEREQGNTRAVGCVSQGGPAPDRKSREGRSVGLGVN
jgi:hypothetical protein